MQPVDLLEQLLALTGTISELRSTRAALVEQCNILAERNTELEAIVAERDTELVVLRSRIDPGASESEAPTVAPPSTE